MNSPRLDKRIPLRSDETFRLLRLTLKISRRQMKSTGCTFRTTGSFKSALYVSTFYRSSGDNSAIFQ